MFITDPTTAHDLALQVQSLSITGPWSPDWTRIFQFKPGTISIIGYDPAVLSEVAGSRLQQLQRVGGSPYTYGGLSVETTQQATAVQAMWESLLHGHGSSVVVESTPQGMGMPGAGQPAAQDASDAPGWIVPAAVGLGLLWWLS